MGWRRPFHFHRSKNRTRSIISLESRGATRLERESPGSSPGISAEQLRNLPSGSGSTYVTCIDFSAAEARAIDILDIDDFLSQHRPEWSTVRWINVDGLSDSRVLHALTEKYELHPLAIEDMLRPGARPKVESYPGDGSHLPRLFIVARMMFLREEHLHCEQVSLFLGRNTLLTFQETHGDIWDPVRNRICAEGSLLRRHDVSYLVYALLDALVDHCFPVLDHLSDRLEEVEVQVLSNPETHVIRQIHDLKHELLLLRREFRPMREVVSNLLRMEHETFTEHTRLFVRDVYDHCVQVIDLLETYREVANGLAEAYMNAMSHRMNQVMKVLTIISTIFIPLSFLAGVYGMNFPDMPEFSSKWVHPWAYPIGFWTFCLLIASTMLLFFKKNRWL
ncbi:MAG: magnesium/cobalt transporter CorA [Verrucomicrobiales bacterium]